MKIIPLAQLKTNQKGRISEVLGGVNLQNKLMNMGVYKGKKSVRLAILA